MRLGLGEPRQQRLVARAGTPPAGRRRRARPRAATPTARPTGPARSRAPRRAAAAIRGARAGSTTRRRRRHPPASSRGAASSVSVASWRLSSASLRPSSAIQQGYTSREPPAPARDRVSCRCARADERPAPSEFIPRSVRVRVRRVAGRADVRRRPPRRSRWRRSSRRRSARTSSPAARRTSCRW